jgi:ABC-type Fe3+ transport system permease subunit
MFTVLFNAGLYFVISFSATQPHSPGPWESAETITTYFHAQPWDVLWCAFLQFGAVIPLGLFTAVVVSRLHFLGRGRQASTFRSSEG